MRLITVLILLTFVSCSTLDYNIPTYRMDTPEVTGDLAKFDIALGAGSGYDVNLATAYDFIINGVVATEYVTGPEPLGTFKANMGLSKKLDVGIQTFPDTTDLLKVKYQFIGGDRSQTGLKLSLQGELGFGYKEEGTLTTASHTYEGTLNARSYGLSLNIGNRVSKSVLFYFNTVWMEYDAEGEFKEGGVTVYNDTQSPSVLLLLPGVRFDFDSAYLQFETGFSALSNSYENSSDEVTYGAVLGYTF